MNQCLRTPEILQQKFDIAHKSGMSRALPRVFMGYDPPPQPRWASRPSELNRRRRPPRKQEALSVLWTLIMAGSLKADGDQAQWAPKRTGQQKLAPMAGLARSSFTRRLSRLANGHGKHCLDPERRPAVELVTRRRSFGMPNEYSLGPDLPARASRPQRKDAGAYSYASLGDCCASRIGHLFAAGAQVGGYKLVPHWVFDAALPISATGRLLMTYYVMCGLLESGICRVKQAKAAAAVGISVRSVRRANKEWEAAGVLRIAHSKPVKHPDGHIQRGPQIVVFLPMRTLDNETASIEAKRLLAARKRLTAQQAHWFASILDIHNSLLSQWRGKEHQISAFHRALRDELARCGVPAAAIAAVVPFQSD